MKRCLSLLFCLEALCFGPYFFKTGFYLDDWWELSHFLPPGKAQFWAGLRDMAGMGIFLTRPLNLLSPILTVWLGSVPWRYRKIGRAHV